MNLYNLIFIHDLKSWSVSQLRDVLNNKISNCFEIIPSIKKLFSPIYGSYFIIRVNINQNTHKFFYLLIDIIKGLPITSKISWFLSNKIPKTIKSKKVKNLDMALNPVNKEFFTNYLDSSSSFVNLCVSWNINGWNSEKKDSVRYLSSVSQASLYLSSRNR